MMTRLWMTRELSGGGGREGEREGERGEEGEGRGREEGEGGGRGRREREEGERGGRVNAGLIVFLLSHTKYCEERS